MIYSPGKFLFIHIPRTGGYSVKQAMGARFSSLGSVTINALPRKVANGGPWCHSTATELKPQIPDWPKITKVAVIRHPLHIVESMWRWHQRYTPWRFRDFEAFVTEKKDYPIPRGGFLKHYCLPEVRLLRFENLQEEWKSLCRDLKLASIPLPHINQIATPRPVPPRVQEIILDRCGEEIDSLDYSRPTL